MLLVRDLDVELARVKQAHVAVATPGGKPVVFADGARAVLIRDIDNRFIELRQPASSPGGDDAGDIFDMRLSIAVNDIDRTTRASTRRARVQGRGRNGFSADKATRALTGLSKAEVRRSRVQAPGSTLWIEFVEYKGVDRTPMHVRSRTAAQRGFSCGRRTSTTSSPP